MVAVSDRFHGFPPDRRQDSRPGYTTYRNRFGGFMRPVDPSNRKIPGNTTAQRFLASGNVASVLTPYGKVITVEQPLDNFGLYIVAHDEAKKMLDFLESAEILKKVKHEDLMHPKTILEEILEQNIINAAEAVAKRWGSTGNVGGQITISAFLKDEKLNLQVSDNGLGFPEALIHEIGKRPFTRTSDLLTNKHRLEEGIENHLYLTSERIKEFGWGLNVENLPDGASVSIVIPIC